MIAEEKNDKAGDSIINASAARDHCEAVTKFAAGLMHIFALAALERLQSTHVQLIAAG